MISLNTPRNATDDRPKGCHVVSSQYPCGHWTTAARPVESTHVIQVSGRLQIPTSPIGTPTWSRSYIPQPSPLRFRMSLVTKENRISVRQFAPVPSLLGLPALIRPDPAVSSVSSFQGAGPKVDPDEGCLLTKTVKYTHKLTRMVDAARSEDSTSVVSRRYHWHPFAEPLLSSGRGH